MRRGHGATREEDLVTFLESRRWFGEKGRGISDARIRDTIPVSWPSSPRPFAVSRLDVRSVEGRSTYQLFSPMDDRGEPIAAVDALQDPDFLRGLADAWQTGCAFSKGGTRWAIASESKVPLVVPADGSITLSPAEQTNSSVILNRQAILKLYRRVEPGVQPDVEVTRFLTVDRGFTHVPALLGVIRFEDGGQTTIAGMLQEFLPEAVDGWRYVLEAVAAHCRDDRPGGSRDAPEFVRAAAQLGSLTRSLHEELAAGLPGTAFAARRATADDVTQWTSATRQMMERAAASMDRAIADGRLEGSRHVEPWTHARRRLDHAMAALDRSSAALAADAGHVARTHGDYHLGQVLRSASGEFFVIDFEGEPLRPLEERRKPQSPLRDVAGMLRSFGYAAAQSRYDGPRAERGDVHPSPELFVEQQMRAAFLDAYFERTETRLLPAGRENADRLLQLFELEKLFYELQYEIDHRPDWVWIPLHGIRRRLS